MRSGRSVTIFLYALLIGLLSPVLFAADTLLYNNSNLTGYWYSPMSQYYSEVCDFGRAQTGGTVTKIKFAYVTTRLNPGTITLRFYYEVTSSHDPWSPFRMLSVSNLQGSPNGGAYVFYKELELSPSQQFTLNAGQAIGYSFQFSNTDTGVAMAQGGYGSVNGFWAYDNWYDFWFYLTSNPWAGCYMQLISGPPIDEITCDIKGCKFNDENGNGARDEGEATLPRWEMYLDTNNDGAWQSATEPNVLTDPNGMYFFENLDSPATYTVREVMQDGWTQTLPGAPDYKYVIATEPNNVYEGYDFGNTTLPPGITVSGHVRMANGSPVSGVRVEAYDNGTTPTGNAAYTDGSGFYELSVPNHWTGSVVPGKNGYEFSDSTLFTNLTTSATEDFTATCQYDGGDGTPATPYRIRTAEQLNAVGAQPTDWDKHFLLTADIDLGGYSGNAFNLIGTTAQPFTGVFDGGGRSIRNFRCTLSGELQVGLFRCISHEQARIANLTLIDSDIQLPSTSLSAAAGILAARIEAGTIENCHISGGVITSDYNTGGIAGYLGSGAFISGCSAACEVESRDKVGGLVGQNLGFISSSQFEGSVSGHRSVGGIAGSNSGYIDSCSSSGTVTILYTASTRYKAGGIAGYNSKSISYCHSSATVSGAEYMGGLVGDNYFADIYECYATGSVSGSNLLGGLVGNNHLSGIVNCYALGNVTGTGSAIGGLIGSNDHSYSTVRQVENSYAAGSVNGVANLGGLAGYDYNGNGNFIKCFWNQTANPTLGGIGNATNPEVFAKTTAQLKTRSTFTSAGWDLSVTWWLCTDGVRYPKLQWEKNLIGDFACPDGIELNDLQVLAGEWLTNGLSRSDIAPAPDGDGWVDLLDFAAFAAAWMEDAGY